MLLAILESSNDDVTSIQYAPGEAVLAARLLVSHALADDTAVHPLRELGCTNVRHGQVGLEPLPIR